MSVEKKTQAPRARPLTRKVERSKKVYSAQCPPGYVTRHMLQQRLGLTRKQMKYLEMEGTLKADKRNSGGWSLYKIEVIQQILNRKSDGSLLCRPEIMEAISDGTVSRVNVKFSPDECQQVFKMIASGMSMAQIVIETGLHSQVVKSIRRDYDYFAEMIVIPKDIIAQMNKIRLPGNFPLTSATDILELLQAAEQTRTCPECCIAPSANRCTSCITRSMNRARRAAIEKGEARERAEAEPIIRVSESESRTGSDV
jgi:hypothetical protein